MSTSNIDRFDHLVGAIFAKLYANFPIGEHFNSGSFNDLIIVDDEDIGGERSQLMSRPEFFVATLKWLINAEYITVAQEIPNSKGTDFLGRTLTAKALEVLKVNVDSLSGKTIGAQLQEATKAGLMDSVKSLTGRALSMGATMGISAAFAWARS